MGQIVTFYSYKGGVGRSMALANTAALLARWGYRTLIVDWDLEAPGLENFYREYSSLQSVPDEKGVVDIISAAYPMMEPEGGDGHAGEAPRQQEEVEAPAEVELPPWRDYVVSIKIGFRDKAEGTLHLLTAGQRSSPEYFRKVRRFDVQDFYREQRGGYFIERLRREWKTEYDVVLIDSRTGVTDIGGICTIQLPDILVLIFTSTEHGLVGAADVARKATLARQSLPFDRRKLLTLPILSRFDDSVEFEISQRWLDRVEEVVKDLYADWLAADVRRRDFVELTKIPYKAFFSFGEKLPVVEEGTVNRAGMAFAYETLAALLANRLEGAEQLRENRDGFVRRAASAERSPAPAGPEVDRALVEQRVEGHEQWLLSNGAAGKAASFAGLYLRASDLSSARLAGADFGKADLNAVNFASSVLEGADFSGASLQGANLRGV
ncbi:MAG TPA: pentapeptide repeat-containing protein, partial [Pyrinomonadaceae bacterium]